jgi:Domain of unknown function (DUF4279)
MRRSADRPSRGSEWKRYDVELFIVHPTLSPGQISAALKLKASNQHAVGEPRRTPKGMPLEGTYADPRWRYSREYRTKNQRFADKVVALLDRVERHRLFLRKLRKTGGSACLLVQLLGEGYFGDQVSPDILKRMADLTLDFGIEAYNIPQSPKIKPRRRGRAASSRA